MNSPRWHASSVRGIKFIATDEIERIAVFNAEPFSGSSRDWLTFYIYAYPTVIRWKKQRCSSPRFFFLVKYSKPVNAFLITFVTKRDMRLDLSYAEQRDRGLLKYIIYVLGNIMIVHHPAFANIFDITTHWFQPTFSCGTFWQWHLTIKHDVLNIY